MRRLDSLSAIAARPALIEFAVRAALVEAMTWRLGGGAPPSEVAFTCAAVAAARQRAATTAVPPASVPEISRATARAAQRFFRAPLGRRMLTLPAKQIAVIPEGRGGPLAIVRDGANHLHAIELTALRHPLEIGARAHGVAAEIGVAPHERLLPIRVHVFSLVTGRRYEYRCSPVRATPSTKRSA